MCSIVVPLVLAAFAASSPSAPETPSAWPQEHAITHDDTMGRLTLSTPYYDVTHDLHAGGAIASIRYPRAGGAGASIGGPKERGRDLLVRPIGAWLEDARGVRFADLRDVAANVHVSTVGAGADAVTTVTLQSGFLDAEGRAAAVRLKSTYAYHWGYIKIRKEFVFPPEGMAVRAVCPIMMGFDSSLSAYGYRAGVSEKEGAGAFAFGSCTWGSMRAGDVPLKLPYVPRYVMLANPGVEGLEWFASSDLSQWEYRLPGKRGQGLFALEANTAGLSLALCPLSLGDGSLVLRGVQTFDCYLGMPLIEGRAQKPWLHTSFNLNKGEWVSSEEVKGWAASGIQTVHCHNDGDYYDDGLFWRDGAYPPYPPADMAAYDRVIADCHRTGIRVATYFSNKELHPSTKEFQEHGEEWGRKNAAGNLQHNFFRAGSEFGAQMCLKSGWLDYLKLCVDRVLTNHKLDGVYYDWNVALYCCNGAHMAKDGAADHWDIDELLAFMEWTRKRVGPDGLVIIHNTTTPMFAVENFADHVVAVEWGYKKWTEDALPFQDLPLEWNLVGARSRGVISYGHIDANAPRRLHRLFALEALLAGVSPWPASPETFEIFPVLAPLGPLAEYCFADWRQTAVRLEGARCAAAVYSRPGAAYALLANLDKNACEAKCVVAPSALRFPLATLTSAVLVAGPGAKEGDVTLDPKKLATEGVAIPLPADSVRLLRLE